MNSLRFSLAACLSVALLAACQSSSPAVAPAAEVTPVLSGRLLGASNTTVLLRNKSKTLASTSVDAGGNFTLTLPTSEQLADAKTSLTAGLLADLGCTGALKLGDPSAQGYAFATLTAGKEFADATLTKTLTTRTLKGRAYLYTDKPTTLSGPLNCSAATGFPTTLQVNVSASVGWNVLALSITGAYSFPSSISVSGSVANGAASPGSLWIDLDTLKTQIAL